MLVYSCERVLYRCAVLRLLVHNPDGLFFAGDTAQTISLGSSFRFNDLKAFLFRLEVRTFFRPSHSMLNSYKERQRAKSSKLAPQEPPKTFQLSVNYRSHDGIVRCAHSVIELITEFWPYAIDSLTREQGVVDGPKPVFFSGWDSETVRYVRRNGPHSAIAAYIDTRSNFCLEKRMLTFPTMHLRVLTWR